MSVHEVTGRSFSLPRRARGAHKGDFGRVYILGGSVGFTGAPVLAARGALRTGAGLVHVGVPREVWPIVAANCLEAMAHPLDPDPRQVLDRAAACDGVLAGPGLGRSRQAEELVRLVTAELDRPLVLDADGLNALAGHTGLLTGRSAPTVLTPHRGEFARLTGWNGPEQEAGGAAAAFAKEHNCILVLKGHRTVTAAPTGELWINTSGNPGMATGGSGDVLAGMILSLLGQGFDPVRAAAMGVWLHGRAGDLAAEELGEYSMTPGDLLDRLPRAVRELEEN